MIVKSKSGKTMTRPRRRLPEVLEFMELLWAIVHGLDRASKRMSHQIGVTGPQRLVLRVVGLFPGMSAGDLAKVLHLHPSTITGVLQRLTGQRLLVRSDDPRDRRRALLGLTPRGTRVNSVRLGTVEAAVGAALLGVSAREQAATRRVLARLALHLDSAPSRRGKPGSSRARPAGRRRIGRRPRG
jgi:DNA-binding MarR family transcriptional regulator